VSVTADIRELVEISQFAGRDVLLAQGGGGNTSVKSGDGRRMWIKASGCRLSEVGEGHGYLETYLPALISVIRDPKLKELPRAVAHEESVRRIQAAVPGPVQKRPSLETGFHAVLGRRVVLHTHPVYVNAFTCMDGGAAALEDALGEQVIWVKYEPPGYALAAEVDRVSMDFQQANGGRQLCHKATSGSIDPMGRGSRTCSTETSRRAPSGGKTRMLLLPATGRRRSRSMANPRPLGARRRGLQR